ncbi:MAG TPA: hypothetical protein QGH10_10710, partial [Armatimonadota bacterium]|nr:hypothetical protein [Armatimonadota bacterium]
AEIGSPLVVTEADGAFTVDTGPMQLAEVVTVDGEVICPSPLAALVLTSADGTEYVATSEVARVELAGPLKTITRTEGPFAAEDGTKLLRHITRATFWAGSSTIELAVTLIDDYLETEFIEISSLELSLGLAGASNATFLVERAPTDVLLNGAPSRLFQRDDEVCTLTSGAGELAAGNHTDGAAAIESADGRGIAVAVEDFWQRYPKALSATEDGLTIELLPDITGETAYGDLPTHLTFPFVGGKYRFKWGMSTTERIALRFRSSEAVPDVTQLGARPLIAVIPSAYYAQTGALGPMAPQVAGEFEAFDDAFANALDRHLEKKEAKREYGFLNWGDWHGERGRNWGNNEYDLAHALFMQFARTGDRRCFRVAQAAARHQADVDCVHAYPDPYYVGANQLHSVCHTGEWSQNLRQPKWSFKYTYHTAATNGHTWSEGMCDAWYLTGDARVMEAAQGLGEHIAWHMAPNFEELGTHERSAGWSLQAIMALYRATRDEAYLDAARRIAIVPLREQKFESTGAWPHVLPGDHAAGVAGAVGNVGFLIGILTSGLGDLHAEAATPELERSLVAAAPFMESLWRPSYRDFQYTSSPGFAEGGSTAGLNGICAQPLGYLYTLTGDEAYLTRVAEAYMGAVRHPSDGFGKSFAQWAREASDLMAVLKSAENPSPVAQRAIALDPTQLLLEDLADVADSSDFRLRGPDGKTFYFLSPGGARTVSASRTLYGAKPKANATGTIRLIAPDGAKLERAEFDTDLPLEWETQLAADSPAGLYTVTIDDDMRAVWDADGEGCKRVLPIETMVQFGAPGTRRYHFSVPGGADSFTVSAVGAHDGEFGLAVYDPEGDMVDWRQGVASGADPGSRTLDLEVRPETSGMWSVVAWARLDLGLRLEGVPAYVSTTADGWFDPTAQ